MRKILGLSISKNLVKFVKKKYILNLIYEKIFIYNQFFYPEGVILSRVACLGKDILALGTCRSKLIINQQKVRIDLFLDLLKNKHLRPKTDVVENYLARKDIVSLINEQSQLPWLKYKGPVKCLFIDSFSELTDQKFIHKKENWSFCCHYSDIDYSSDFNSYFDCNGLLDLRNLEMYYEQFFDWFIKLYPGVCIYYVHFPAKFDDRQVFKNRAETIKEIMYMLEKKHSFLRNVAIDDSLIEKSPDDNFPYHLTESTIKSFRKIISGVI